MTKHRAVAFLLLCSSTVPQWAMAQEKDPVTETARRRFSEGVRFFDEKRYEEARAAFLQAYALKRHPAVLLNLAQSEVRSNHPLDAARHFAGFLRESSTASAVERAEAERGLAAARTKLGRLQIAVNANGADVLVDGESVGASPLAEPVDTVPGTHTIEARLGRRSASTTATVTAGRTGSVTLTIEAAPLAGVGAASGATTATGPRVAPAVPEAAAPREEEPPGPTPPSSPSGETPGRPGFFAWVGQSGVGLTGLGVTAVGLGLFAGFGLAAMKAADNADSVANKIIEHGQKSGSTRTNLCSAPIDPVYGPPCATLRDNLDRRDTDRTLATIGIIAAGVGLTTTITAYLLSSPSSEPTTTLVPLIKPGLAGLSLGGSF